ncbi:MAG: hypothetical protein ACREVO_08100 [Steroidobacteraceae bacterium]
MRRLPHHRLLALVAVLAALAGCATNRIARCEGHLVPINPPPPKPAMAAPVPAQKSQSARRTGHTP